VVAVVTATSQSVHSSFCLYNSASGKGGFR
jgi:hypothetical protein